MVWYDTEETSYELVCMYIMYMYSYRIQVYVHVHSACRYMYIVRETCSTHRYHHHHIIKS